MHIDYAMKIFESNLNKYFKILRSKDYNLSSYDGIFYELTGIQMHVIDNIINQAETTGITMELSNQLRSSLSDSFVYNLFNLEKN